MYRSHICIIAPVHPWDDIRVFQKEAASLARWNYRVTLFARGRATRRINGVQIMELPSYRKRIHRFFSIPKIFWRVSKEKADFYHLHNPDTLPLGFALKLTGRKVIYDVHEDFVYRIQLRHWIRPFFRPFLSLLIHFIERLAGLVFDGVIVTQSEVLSRMGKRTVIIRNAPIATGMLIESAYELSQSIKKNMFFRVIYVGRIGRSRGLMEMIEAMGILNQKITSRLWLIGEADRQCLAEARQHDAWRHVDYIGPLPQDQAFSYMIKSDAGLVTILDVGDHRYTSANKIYEYQRFALPFVASNFQKWMDQLISIGSGIFVNPSRPDEIARALHWIAAHPGEAAYMGKKGQDYILNDFNWERESENLYNLYSRLRK